MKTGSNIGNDTQITKIISLQDHIHQKTTRLTEAGKRRSGC
uniref:Uncharacterized protein n=1 Tax=Arundo donax TaxID=35708 RepID=A0A0A9GJ30_ARUDO